MTFVSMLLSPLVFCQTPGVVNVENFGAVADGSDSTAAILRAVAALRTGQQLYFPCTNGYLYHVSSPISFAGLQQVQIQGASAGCGMLYSSSRSQPYAFNFVGASNINIRNINFDVASGNQPPSVVVLLGRTSSNAWSGLLRFNNVQVQGYATKAIVYSIASEQNTWIEPTIVLRGGGALYAFYTSSHDDLNVNNLPTSSNLSVWMQNFNLVDWSSGIDSSHSLVFDNGWSSGAGSHTYRDGYLSSYNGTAFTINADQGTIAWMGLSIDSNRFENGYQMFEFSGGGSFGDIALTNNKSGGVSKYMIHLPSTCYDCTFQGNSIAQSDSNVSVFGTLSNSQVSENYPFSYGNTVNSYVMNRTSGALQIGSSSTSVSCSSALEGTMQYLKGSGNTNGIFRICQRVSGAYAWVAH